MRFDFPNTGEAIAVHDALIEAFGGTMGLREEGAPASGIMRLFETGLFRCAQLHTWLVDSVRPLPGFD